MKKSASTQLGRHDKQINDKIFICNPKTLYSTACESSLNFRNHSQFVKAK